MPKTGRLAQVSARALLVSALTVGGAICMTGVSQAADPLPAGCHLGGTTSGTPGTPTYRTGYGILCDSSTSGFEFRVIGTCGDVQAPAHGDVISVPGPWKTANGTIVVSASLCPVDHPFKRGWSFEKRDIGSGGE